ncbi:MAG: cytochrome-c peroxidase, partial [Leptospira sp.]|nr:cytochrome-c peroxidase [Leptospira sp.]
EKKDDPFLVPDQIPAPEDNKITKKRTQLGKFLFFDPGLSGINSPTIVNVAFGDLQFWDGRAISLESQATGPITFRVK